MWPTPKNLKYESIKPYLYPIKIAAGMKQNMVKHIIRIRLWYFFKIPCSDKSNSKKYLRNKETKKIVKIKKRFIIILNSNGALCHVAPSFPKLFRDVSSATRINKKNALNVSIKVKGLLMVIMLLHYYIGTIKLVYAMILSKI